MVAAPAQNGAGALSTSDGATSRWRNSYVRLRKRSPAALEVGMAERSNEESVLGVFNELRRAMLANDLGPLRALVAENYRGGDAGGRMHAT